MKQMSLLIQVEDFDNFRLMRDVKPDSITPRLRDVMRNLDERDEMEPFLRLSRSIEPSTYCACDVRRAQRAHAD